VLHLRHRHLLHHADPNALAFKQLVMLAACCSPGLVMVYEVSESHVMLLPSLRLKPLLPLQCTATRTQPIKEQMLHIWIRQIRVGGYHGN
jgi:hypothetical protein